MYKGNALNYARRREYINALDFSRFDIADTAVDPAAVGPSGVQMLHFESVGANVYHTMRLPSYFDITHPIGVTLEWATASSTDADSVTWLVRYAETEIGEAIPTALTSYSALNTAISAQSVDTLAANVLRETSRGVINATTLSKGSRISFNIEMDAATDPTDAAYLGALILDYMPKWMDGPGANRDRQYRTSQDETKWYLICKITED